MQVENIKIVASDGEYKDFPNKYAVYLYGHKVWEDDFNEVLSEQGVMKEFIKDLQYLTEELDG